MVESVKREPAEEEKQEQLQDQEQQEEALDSERISTFKGHLPLDQFKFIDASAPARRSPRISARSGALPAPDIQPASSPSRNKRRASSAATSTASGSPNVAAPTADPTAAPSSKSRQQKRQRSTGYAPPSRYAHLPLLPDAVSENLLVFFVGLNPGITTASSGHAYAHPSNLFWKLLYSSGLTTRLCSPQEDRQLPELFRLGFTNIVSRPSRNGSELSNREMDDGVAALEEKARRWKPEAVCIVGKSIWESIWRVKHGGKAVGKAFRYGWQDESENMGVGEAGQDEGEAGQGKSWKGAKVFVATTTSGLAASMSPAEKQEIWRQLGSWAEKRRKETEAQGDGGDEGEEVTSSHFP